MRFRQNLPVRESQQVRWLDLLAQRPKIFLGANAGKA
jgi:hypothetical protein